MKKHYIILKGASIKHEGKHIILKQDTHVIGWVENNMLFFYYNHRVYNTSIYNAVEEQ